MARKPSLKWRRQPDISRFARSDAVPPGYDLLYSNTVVSSLYHWSPPCQPREYRGYFWTIPAVRELGLEFFTSYFGKEPTWQDHQLEEAKTYIRQYILKRIKEHHDH